MIRWHSLLLLGASLPFSAQAEESQFDDLFLSETMISPSQTYQYTRRRCEMAGVLGQGNIKAETFELTIEIRAQAVQFACVHNLDSNTLVLGLVGDMVQYTADGVVVRRESVTTSSYPFLAFNLTPNFTFGVGEQFDNDEYKSQSGSYAVASNRLILGGTFHQPNWETTLYYADRYRDTQVTAEDIPRETRLQVRYSLTPYGSIGATFGRVDYPGVADGNPAQIEKNQQIFLATRFLEKFGAEAFLEQTTNLSGDPTSDGTRTGLMATVALNPDFRVGGKFEQFAATDANYKYAVSTYSIVLALTP